MPISVLPNEYVLTYKHRVEGGEAYEKPVEGFAELRPCQNEYRGPVGHQSQQADDWHDNGLNHKTVDRNNGKHLSTRRQFYLILKR